MLLSLSSLHSPFWVALLEGDDADAATGDIKKVAKSGGKNQNKRPHNGRHMLCIPRKRFRAAAGRQLGIFRGERGKKEGGYLEKARQFWGSTEMCYRQNALLLCASMRSKFRSRNFNFLSPISFLVSRPLLPFTRTEEDDDDVFDDASTVGVDSPSP